MWRGVFPWYMLLLSFYRFLMKDPVRATAQTHYFLLPNYLG